MIDQTEAERRAHPRTKVHLPVTVMVERRPVPGDLVDISAGGLLFHTRVAIETEQSVEVTLTVAPNRVCTGAGLVSRVAQGRGFGVKFYEANDAMREFVADLLLLRDDLRSDFLSRVVNPMVVVNKAA